MRIEIWYVIQPPVELRIPMRGYEDSPMLLKIMLNGCYESPWGVMSSSSPSNCWLLPKVTNPHEGLWVCCAHCLPHIYFCVTNPHEGLWVSVYRLLQTTLQGYESPWGVMSLESVYIVHKFFPVTNPHEGLWELLFPTKTMKTTSYESPWGVMRPFEIFINNAVSGYESPWGVMRQATRQKSWNVLPRYESPWGVMRLITVGYSNSRLQLRIPMRGYEGSISGYPSNILNVTNPHEGLWVTKAKWKKKI